MHPAGLARYASHIRKGRATYSVVKAAIEGLTLSLRREVTPFGITAMTVEVGGFRTDLAGRSLVQPETPIADYVETAGKRRKEPRAGHGMQPGYPARAAAALIDALRAALDAWKDGSRSIDFTD